MSVIDTMSTEELIEWDCPLADQVLAKKCQQYVEKHDHEYGPMSFEDFNAWKPTEDDIYSICESIKFWSNTKPKGEKETWTKFQFKVYCEAVKKEKMLTKKLGEIPSMDKFAMDHLQREKRKILKAKLRKDMKVLKHARTCNK